MTVVTQIKRDAEQASVVNQSNVKHLEEKFEVALKESKEAPEIISQSIKQIHEVASENIKSIDFLQGRATYLRHVVLANRKDSQLYLKELKSLHQIGTEHKDRHQKDLHQQKSEQQDMENGLQVKISAAIHQLKGLTFLQEIKEQLIQQTLAVKQLIEEEKQLNSDDLTSIRRQIFDQRDFYENDLKIRLEAAKRFAKEFADLHTELVTNKIRNETAQNRKKLQEVSEKTIEVLRENDVLRKKHNSLDQKFRINQSSFENLQSDYSTLRLSHTDYEDKAFNILNEHKNSLKKLREEKDDTIGELKLRKEEALERREQLKQELMIVKRDLQKIETYRSESYQKEYEILDSMNQTATFILTAIDKSINEEMIQNEDFLSNSFDQIPTENNTIKSSPRTSPRTSPRNLKLTKNYKSRSQKSELSRLMLRLQDVFKHMQEDTINSQLTLKKLNIEKIDVEVQTEQLIQSENSSEKVQPPSLLETTQNPRRKASMPTSRRAPRILVKSRTTLPKKRTLTRPSTRV